MPRKRQRSRGTGSVFKRGGRGPWIASWYSHDGRRKERSTRTTDKAAADRILGKLVADAALRREGVIDAKHDGYTAAARRPISEHLGEFKAALRAKGDAEKHARSTHAMAEWVVTEMQVERIADLTPSRVRAAVATIRENGRSLRTCNAYLRAIKQFTRWLRRDGRVGDDVLAHLSGYNASTDRRLERRALGADELVWLIEQTITGPVWRGLSGADRAMLYQVATGTGFRASELHSLTPASFRLDDDRPAIALRPESSKRRRDDVQPIRSDLADALRSWLSDKPLADAVWPGHWNEKAARMIRADLRRAKARWIRAIQDRGERRLRRDSEFLALADDAGRVVDFHALRTTFITMLVKSGASMRVAQELARHSDPKLTMNVYSKLGVHDLSGALDRLPSLTGDKPEGERMRATGTDNVRASAPADPPQYPQQLGRETMRSGAAACSDGATPTAMADTCNQPRDADLSGDVRRDARECETASPGTRTPDPLIKSQLLCQLS